jgi:hypothetical protein
MLYFALESLTILIPVLEVAASSAGPETTYLESVIVVFLSPSKYVKLISHIWAHILHR